MLNLLPYKRNLTLFINATLGLGLIIAIIDAITVGINVDVFMIVLALYLQPLLYIALCLGVMVGGFHATLTPEGHFFSKSNRKLLSDSALDRKVVAVIAALLISLACFVLLLITMNKIAFGLTANTDKAAFVAAAAAILAILFFGLLTFLFYQITRSFSHIVPRTKTLSATYVFCLLSLGLVFVVALLVKTIIKLFLVYLAQAFGIAAYDTVSVFFVALLPALFVLYVWLVLVWGLRNPFKKVPFRLKRLVPFVLVGIGLTSLIWVNTNTSLNPSVIASLSNHPRASLLLMLVRQFHDNDNDGYSDYLGGPDCDDSNAKINPASKEITDNGIDEDCSGEDLVSVKTETPVAEAPLFKKPQTCSHIDNLLIIMIDTLRADRMGYTGYRRNGKSLTPNIDKLASKSAVFLNAYAQSANTPRSYPSMITSKFPSQVHVDKVNKPFSTVLDKETTMFELISKQGIHTAQISSHFYFKPVRGTSQGIDDYDNKLLSKREGISDIGSAHADIAAPRLVKKTVSKLKKYASTGQPFVLFTHFFEPHSAYMVHPEFPTMETKFPKNIVERYDYEIAFLDKQLGQVFDLLDETNLSQNTGVLILSDHGETFGLHRLFGKKMFDHGQTLYNDILRVPLLLYVPCKTKGKMYDDLTMLIDIPPTILTLLGIESPQTFEGHSLTSLIFDDIKIPPRPVYAELLPYPTWPHKWKALITPDRRYKLIHRVSDNIFEVYDLKNDPDEQNNIAFTNRSLTTKLKQELSRFTTNLRSKN